MNINQLYIELLKENAKTKGMNPIKVLQRIRINNSISDEDFIVLFDKFASRGKRIQESIVASIGMDVEFEPYYFGSDNFRTKDDYRATVFDIIWNPDCMRVAVHVEFVSKRMQELYNATKYMLHYMEYKNEAYSCENYTYDEDRIDGYEIDGREKDIPDFILLKPFHVSDS